ncbi:MAG: hypothetical protein OQL19_02380 [Gammaproteobacteria bacterium]|nr:hypothetical protein [Gammaproteobacteria bacterium]
MNKSLTKYQKSILRDLAENAHENELNSELEKLFENFLMWADKGMSASELNDEIHIFHNGVSRELYKTYVLGEPMVSVAIGLSRKAIAESDIDMELMSILRPLVENFSNTGEKS